MNYKIACNVTNISPNQTAILNTTFSYLNKEVDYINVSPRTGQFLMKSPNVARCIIITNRTIWLRIVLLALEDSPVINVKQLLIVRKWITTAVN